MELMASPASQVEFRESKATRTKSPGVHPATGMAMFKEFLN
jgi:hypothetical protein